MRALCSVLHLCGSLLCLILVLLVGWQDLSVRCEAGWLFGPRRSNLLVCPVTGRGAVPVLKRFKDSLGQQGIHACQPFFWVGPQVITGVCAGFTPELSTVACISCCIQPGQPHLSSPWGSLPWGDCFI